MIILQDRNLNRKQYKLAELDVNINNNHMQLLYAKTRHRLFSG